MLVLVQSGDDGSSQHGTPRYKRPWGYGMAWHGEPWPLPPWSSLPCSSLGKCKIRRSLYAHKMMKSAVNNSWLFLCNMIVFQICLSELAGAEINEFLLFSVTDSWDPANGLRLCRHEIVKNCLKLYPYGQLIIYCFKHLLNNAAQRTDWSWKFKKVELI